MSGLNTKKKIGDYTYDGKVPYLAGSEKIVVGDSVLYAHHTLFCITCVKGDSVLFNHAYESKIQYNTALSNAVKKLKVENKKRKAGHSLVVGTVLMSNTNINTPALNSVEFYQVVEVIGTKEVSICLIDQDVLLFQGHKAAVPCVGKFKGEPFVRSVLVNTVRISGLRIASISPKTEYAGGDIVVYDPQKFGA